MRKWIALSLIMMLIFVGCGQVGTESTGNTKIITINAVSLEPVPYIQIGDDRLKATDDYMVYYYDKHNFVVGPSFTSSQTHVLVWFSAGDKTKHIDITDLLSVSGGSFNGIVWVLNDKLYVFVLTDMVGQGMKGDVYAYDSGKWHKIYTVTTPADVHKAVVHNGVVYLYGGRAGLLQLKDDGTLTDIGNLDHVSAVGFVDDKAYILAGLNPPTVYEYTKGKEPVAKRSFKITTTTSWVGICDFHGAGIQPLFLLMKYEGGGDLLEKYLYVYDVVHDKVIFAGKVDDEFYRCFVYDGKMYIQGEDVLYRLRMK